VTRSGWAALVGGAVLVLLGVVLSWPAAAVIGAGAIALVALSLAFLLRPQKLEVSRWLDPARIPRGEEALVHLTIGNSGGMTIPAQRAEQTVGAQEMRFVLPRLRKGTTVERSFPLPTDKRGVFEVAPFSTTRQDPFGLVKRTRAFGEAEELWVYPRILPFRPLPAGFSRPAEGPTSDMAPQGSLTFHRLREYVVGDDLRYVHWKSTARTGKLMVRHMVDTSQPFTVVVTDLRPQVYSETTFELALDAAASAVVAASRSTGPIQMRLTDGTVVGDEDTADMQRPLDLLTAAEPDPNGSLTNELLRLRRERGGTTLVIVTGAIDPMDVAAASRLKRAFYRVMIISVVEPGSVPSSPTMTPGVTVLTVSTDDELVGGWNLEAFR
jgi:uncharacterized protein (DUF58 family)